MSIEHPSPRAALDALRAALTHLQALAAAPSADPFYASAAEQVAAIVTSIEGRVTPLQEAANPGAPLGPAFPPSPGVGPPDPCEPDADVTNGNPFPPPHR